MGPAARDSSDASAAADSRPKDGAQWLRRTLGQTLGELAVPAGWPVLLAALLILATGCGVFITIPALYARLDTYLSHLPPVVVVERSENEALQVIMARAALYPLAKGGQALVIRGEVRNQSDQPQAATDAQLELKDAHGFVVAHARSPLGFSPRLTDVFHINDDQEWQSLVQQTRAIVRAPLAPQATATFMLVVVQPPQVLAATVPEISLP